MKKGDLVRFERGTVSELLNGNVDNWMGWMGVIIEIENEDFCRVSWFDGCIRQEFMEYLEVISESR